MRESALALGGGGGGGGSTDAGPGEIGKEGDGVSYQPPVDGAAGAEYDDADDDVLGAAEAAMEREGMEEGEGDEDDRTSEAAEQEAKKRALLARHAVLAGRGEEVQLVLKRVPKWRRGAVVKVEDVEGERGDGEEGEEERRRRRALIRGAVVMDLT